jgi:O-antigen/teichoic acid export membrane protein
LILNNLGVAVVNAAIMSRYAWTLYPELRLSSKYCSRAKAKTMLVYGTNLQVSKIAQIVTFQTDRIFSLRFFGTSNATHYDLGVRVNSAARTVTASLVTALIPAVSEMETLDQREQLAALYERGTKYVVTLAAFLFLFIFIFADPLIAAWLGEGYGQTVVFVRILTLGYFANIVTAVSSAMTAGLGRTNIDRNYGILMGIVNIVLVVVLALTVGAYGIAIATSMSLTIGSLYFLGAFHRSFGLRHWTIARIYIKPLLFGALSIGAMRWALQSFYHGPAVLVILLGASVAGGAYIWLLVIGRAFDQYDRDKFAIITSSLRKKIGRRGRSV